MKVSELVEIVDGIAPFALAMDFDNPGLILGDREGEVTSVLVALDATLSVVEEARRLGAEVIVSHHPAAVFPHKAYPGAGGGWGHPTAFDRRRNFPHRGAYQL